MRRVEENLESFWDTFSDGVVAIDRDLKIIGFSKGAERITGYTAEEVMGLTCKEVFKTDICEENSPIEKALKTGETLANLKAEVENFKGEKIIISLNITPLKDRRGNIVGAVMNFRDVGEVYRLTTQLFKETARLQSILNSIADGVFTIDTQWRITSFNPSAERITGYKREEIIGKPCHYAFRSKLCGEDCPLRKTIETGESIYNFEMEIINAKGEVVPISVSTALLIDEEGEIIGGVETFRDLSTLKRLKEELEERYSFSNIIGRNARMQEIYNLIQTVSETSSTVLIQGETGTGKELVARAIHYNSSRKDKPFIKVSCAALPETLLESELFGYKRGAFTGAVKDKPGRFELADKGTIFLDEIGEIPLSIQVKLLRVLEEQEIEPLGSTRPIKVDVRIIAATNRDLKKAVREGKFREDLYYRLNVVSILLPPLRERQEDIPLLVRHFIKKFNKRMGKEIDSVSKEAMDALIDYAWPGNVRELENAIEHAFIYCKGRVIEVKDLPKEVIKSKGLLEKSLTSENPLEEMEKEIILEALKYTRGDRGKVASMLKISRTTLWRKMKKYGII